MRRRYGRVILSVVFASGMVAQEGPHPFVKQGKWGYVDSAGSVVIPPRFDLAGWFAGGFAAVKSGLSWSIISEAGTEVPQLSFTSRPETPVSEGLLGVRTGANGQLGFISMDGVLRIPPRFDAARPFSEGLAAVRDGKQWLFVARNGDRVWPGAYDFAESFSEGYAVVGVGGKVGFVDHAGNFLAPPRFDAALSFSSGMAAVKVGSKWGYVASNGEMAIAATFDEAKSFSEGLAPVRKGFLWGYIDHLGKFKLAAQFREAEEFSCGLAAVEDSVNWKTGYIDRSGRFEVKPRFQSGEPFSADGVARVVLMPGDTDHEAHRNLGWAYIDRRGGIIWTNVMGPPYSSEKK